MHFLETLNKNTHIIYFYYSHSGRSEAMPTKLRSAVGGKINMKR